MLVAGQAGAGKSAILAMFAEGRFVYDYASIHADGRPPWRRKQTLVVDGDTIHIEAQDDLPSLTPAVASQLRQNAEGAATMLNERKVAKEKEKRSSSPGRRREGENSVIRSGKGMRTTSVIVGTTPPPLSSSSSLGKSTIANAPTERKAGTSTPDKQMRKQLSFTGGQKIRKESGDKVSLEMDGQRFQCVMLVYSLTRRKSLKVAESIGMYIRQYLDPTVPFLLVGNKVDLDSARRVSAEEAQAVAAKLKCPLVECSARYDTNIKQVFMEAVRQGRNADPTDEKKGRWQVFESY